MPRSYLLSLRAWAASEGWVYLGAAVLATLATILGLELWRADLSIPMVYNGDATSIAVQVKIDVLRGWYEWEPLLAAPFGQNFHDYKAADNLHHAIFGLTGLFTDDWAWAENSYYLVGYPLAAVTAAGFFRQVGIARPLAIALSVCFAIAPYHIFRQEVHLWLTSYWALPLAMIVVYWVASGQRVWRRGTRGGPVGKVIFSRSAFAVVALALAASTNSYYGFFMIAFLAMAGLARFVSDRRWRRLAGAFAASVWTAMVMLANMMPDFIYAAIHGQNGAAVTRFPSEAEVYALKLTQLLLPMHGHRFEPFDDFRAMYDRVYPFPAGMPALGLIASAGLLIGLVVVFAKALGSVKDRAWEPIGALAGLALFGLLVAALGGLGTIASFFTSDLRGWDRMSILIMLLALGVIGHVLGMVLRRPRREQWRTIGVWMAAGALLIVSFWDQTSPRLVPAYENIAAEFAADGALVSQITDSVGSDASILQMPLVVYPESTPVNFVSDTDQLKPFLHSDTIKWSGGAIKGRATTEWQVALERLPVDQIPLAIAATEFDGVLLDLRTLQRDDLRSALVAAFGEPTLTSHEGRFEFYVVPHSDSDDVGFLVTHALYARFSPSLYDGWSILETAAPYRPEIVMDNPRPMGAEVAVAFDIANVTGPTTLRFTLPNGETEVRRITQTASHVEFTSSFEPGFSVIGIESIGGNPIERELGTQGTLQVSELRVRDPGLDELLGDLRQ